MNRKNTFIKNTLILTVTSFLNRTIGLIFRSYMSLQIGAHGLGVYGLILQTYSFAATFTATGVSFAVTRLISEELAKNTLSKTSRVKKIVCTGFIISFVISIMTSIFLFIFAPSIGKNVLHEPQTILSLKILCFSLPFVALSASLRGYFYGCGKILSSACEQIFEQLCEILVFALLIKSFLPHGTGMACCAIVIGTVVSEALSCVFALIIYWSNIKNHNAKSRQSFTKKIVLISFPVTLSACICSFLNIIEHILVPIGLQKFGFSKQSALASYGVITGMVSPLICFPSALFVSVSSLIVPEISRSNVLGKQADVRRIIFKVLRLCAIFSLTMTFFFLFFANFISNVVYKNDVCAVYLRIISPLVPLMYLDTIMTSILKSLNYQLKILSYNIVTSITKIILTFTLVPIWGINGQLIVIFLSCILNFCLILLKILKILAK